MIPVVGAGSNCGPEGTSPPARTISHASTASNPTTSGTWFLATPAVYDQRRRHSDTAEAQANRLARRLRGVRVLPQSAPVDELKTQPGEAGNGASRSRVVRLLSGTSCVLLCLAVVLVVCQYLPVNQTPGSAGWWVATIGFLAWVLLPPIGVLLALPGLRRPQSRGAVLGCAGHGLLFAWLMVFMTFFFSFA